MSNGDKYVTPSIVTLKADKLVEGLGPATALGSGRSGGDSTSSDFQCPPDWPAWVCG